MDKETGKERNLPKMSKQYIPEQMKLQQNLMFYSVNREVKRKIMVKEVEQCLLQVTIQTKRKY